MIRYSAINEKNKREIVLLRGCGCSWRRCRFCDYHLDYDPDEAKNFELNKEQLDKVTGVYGRLEIVNSGSFVDLDELTMQKVENTCARRGIKTLHFECHWMHREQVAPLRARFAALGVNVMVKTGVETFDSLFRENYLDKGITAGSPKEIAEYFDECCLLVGLPGQTTDSMLLDIKTGLEYFERVCVNVMAENSSFIKPDPSVIELFERYVYPIYAKDYRVDILMENTDFGVG